MAIRSSRLQFYCTLPKREGTYISDFISLIRHPNNNNDENDLQNSLEAFVNFITNHGVPEIMSLHKLKNTVQNH